LGVLETDCAEMRLKLLRESQFTGANKIFLSAAAISSTQPEKRAFRFVKNDMGVVIGEILSDGISLSPSSTIRVVELCFDVPKTFVYYHF